MRCLVKRNWISAIANKRLTHKINNQKQGSHHNWANPEPTIEWQNMRYLSQWRTPRDTGQTDWQSKLKVFENSEQTSDYIIMMQKPIDLRIKSVVNWFRKREIVTQRALQQFIPERHKILGPDLAAAHFILYQGGAVKFHDNDWIKGESKVNPKLPNVYDANYKLEGLRCDSTKLYYEGVENIRYLQYLKYLSFHNIPTFDDWCLDRISGLGFPNLEILDISKTVCTVKSFSCLYRLNSLKLLIVDEQKDKLQYDLYSSMLMEVIPQLKILTRKAK